MNRRTFLKAIAAGAAGLPLRGRPKVPKQKFRYFDGTKYVDADPDVLLTRLQALAEETAFTSQFGIGERYDHAETMNGFRWVFSIPRLDRDEDPKPYGLEIDGFVFPRPCSGGRPAPFRWFEISTFDPYWIGACYPVLIPSRPGPGKLDDGKVLKIVEDFLTRYGEKAFRIASDAARPYDDPADLKYIELAPRKVVTRKSDEPTLPAR